MTRLRFLLVLSTSLAACAAGKDTILPADGPTMKAIYTAHFADIGLEDSDEVRWQVASRPIHDGTEDLAGYTRDAQNELDLRFPRLPNPTLVLYVYPHLAGAERVPVPGYATTFTLYERVEYALPGDFSGRIRADEHTGGQ